MLKTPVCLLVLLALTTGVIGAQRPVDDPIAILQSYVGRYELTPTFHLTVTREGRAVYVQATGQPRAPLTPRVGHEFVIVGSSLRVIFSVDEDTGLVVDLLCEMGGLGRRAVKLADAAAPPAPTRIALPVAALPRYVGTYEEQPGFGITITQSGDHLMAQVTELAAAPIYPVSETEFFYEDARGSITFRVDGARVVTALTLHQGGSDLEMPRVDE